MEFPPGLIGHALKYQISKVLAHKASLDFINTQNPHYPLITLHPTFVLGPSLVQKSAEDVSGGNMLFMQSLASEKPLFPPALVDVRDVAQATLGAIDAKVERSGEEFIHNGLRASWEEVVGYVKRDYPSVEVKLLPPFDKAFDADGAKAEKYMGVKWRPTEEIIRSLMDQQLGFLKEKA
jgi:nucleoside-diphosphate-sugar epimerase